MNLLVIVFFLIFLWSGFTKSSPLVIVEQGQARASIVIATNDPHAKESAKGLQKYIEKISGARLDILIEPVSLSKQIGIYIGHTQKARNTGIKIPSGYDPSIRKNVFKNEGFVLHTKSKEIFIAGNADGPYQGTIFGTYAFLEKLGCRWFFPGEWGECIPRMKTIKVPHLKETSRPDFPLRFISPGGTYGSVSYEERKIYADWANKIGFTLKAERGEFYPMVGDGFLGIHLPPHDFWKEHPEYYAMNKKGKRYVATGDIRHWTMLCLSNPDVFNQIRINLKDAFAGKREGHRLSKNGFGISPPDGSPYCFCESCKAESQKFFYPTYFSKKKQAMSEEYYEFSSKLAKAFPNKWIATMAYSLREIPPQGVHIPPNIAVMYCPITVCALHPNDHPTCWRRQEYTRILKSWKQRTPHVYLYDYNPHFFDGLYVPLCPLKRLAIEIPMYKKMDLRGFNAEGRKAFMQTWISYYITAKLLWDADTNIEEIKKDFYNTFFGFEAGKHVQEWWDACDNAFLNTTVHVTESQFINHVYTKKFVNSIRHHVRAALDSNMTHVQRERMSAFVLIANNLSAYAEFHTASATLDFRRAAQELENMMVIQEKLAAIHSFFITPRYMNNHIRFAPKMKWRFEQLDAMTNGEEGELIAPLPIEMYYSRDPFNEGVINEWFAPGKDDSAWEKVNTFFLRNSQVEYENKKGHGYRGYSWYRTHFSIPNDFTQKPVYFRLGRAENEAWFWINGQYTGHIESRGRRGVQSKKTDVSNLIIPGEKNQMTIRIWNVTDNGGLSSRSFFWAPITHNISFDTQI